MLGTENEETTRRDECEASRKRDDAPGRFDMYTRLMVETSPIWLYEINSRIKDTIHDPAPRAPRFGSYESRV